jgi:hypothetical protein
MTKDAEAKKSLAHYGGQFGKFRKLFRTNSSTYVCMCVCMCVCVYVFVCIHTYVFDITIALIYGLQCDTTRVQCVMIRSGQLLYLPTRTFCCVENIQNPL